METRDVRTIQTEAILDALSTQHTAVLAIISQLPSKRLQALEYLEGLATGLLLAKRFVCDAALYEKTPISS